MRQSLLLSASRLALLLAVVLIAGEVSAQSIEVGTLRQITAPCAGPMDSYAIGYDGDTVETEEPPSLYGFNTQVISRSGLSLSYFDNTNDYVAEYASKQSFGECIDCELRKTEQTTSYATKDYSFALYHR